MSLYPWPWLWVRAWIMESEQPQCLIVNFLGKEWSACVQALCALWRCIVLWLHSLSFLSDAALNGDHTAYFQKNRHNNFVCNMNWLICFVELSHWVCSRSKFRKYGRLSCYTFEENPWGDPNLDWVKMTWAHEACLSVYLKRKQV